MGSGASVLRPHVHPARQRSVAVVAPSGVPCMPCSQNSHVHFLSVWRRDNSRAQQVVMNVLVVNLTLCPQEPLVGRKEGKSFTRFSCQASLMI